MIFAFLHGSELLIVAVVIVILFGATKIPQLGDALGKGIRNFRQALNTKDEGPPPALEDKSNAASTDKQPTKTQANG
jgi:sec-independent protein translocase protein TatA